MARLNYFLPPFFFLALAIFLACDLLVGPGEPPVVSSAVSSLASLAATSTAAAALTGVSSSFGRRSSTVKPEGLGAAFLAGEAAGADLNMVSGLSCLLYETIKIWPLAQPN